MSINKKVRTAARKPGPKADTMTAEAIGTVLGTQAGPSTAAPDPGAPTLKTPSQRRLAQQKAGAQRFARSLPSNPLKAGEIGLAGGAAPAAGEPMGPADPVETASTVTERNVTDKTGRGAMLGRNAANQALDRVRVDSGGRVLTTSVGVAISDNQNSLKAGLRGPSLLEDFVLREKIMHFDHERIPERVVHARGSGAHGYFECTRALDKFTRAAPFSKVGKRTPVFVRFSTVVGERGSTDLARDVRGFAVKFYTDEGNWDLVGNNIPVFFIQDAMKFPDLVHAVKPEPNNQMPQAASAHDTFWDFAGLMPEITHMLLWVMSDRAIPRSYRTMQGFGVHTFRLVNEAGQSVFCKFHWNPVAGTHSLVWDEAVKVSGADPDFHRRDLWEAIEGGNYPEYELGLQIFTEEQAEKFTFDVLDATKIVPEELVPVQVVGRMVLDRNPDNFFAETEQVAFCTANLVPGIDTSNDPLLQGRHFSYLDTQLTRLGGPNFNELPINASLAQVHNNQRDGFHRQGIARGRVAYEPNSLGGGCPFQAGMRGFRSFPEPVRQDKVRAKPEKFADHYSQATLFWNSQTEVEKRHIVAAFRFELTRVQVQAVRERILGLLANVDDELAARVAEGLGVPVPPPQPRVGRRVTSEVDSSPALSLMARPGDGSVKSRKVALLVADGIEDAELRRAYAALAQAGAVPRFLGARLGRVAPAQGDSIHVEVTFETAPSVLWDAVVIPGGAQALTGLGTVREFVRDQYRHCKPMLLLGDAQDLLETLGIPSTMPDGSPDPGLVTDAPAASGKNARRGAPGGVRRFIEALGQPRPFERERDPAPV
ncbi:MAG: catalase [Panacagrimonas sp.]|nr:catalase [Panacagrimonas sp.]MCC2658690.1 catalase [Panacagrimonas sp.]